MKDLLIGVALLASAAFGGTAPIYRVEFKTSGYAGTTALAGFPVAVRLSENSPAGFDYAKCAADGSDLRFGSADGSVAYPHEIETWNPQGESIVWVRLPELGDAETTFAMTFGGADGSALPAASVWSGASGANYAAVWHYSDVNRSGDANAVDSAQGLVGVPSGRCPSEASPVGQGTWFWFQGQSYSRLFVDGWKSLGVAGDMTVSTWIKMPTNAYYSNGLRVIGQSAEEWNSDNSWMIQLQSAMKLRVYGRSKSADFTIPDVSADWVHLVVVYEGGTASVYANGELVESKSIDAPADNGKLLALGATGKGGWPLAGGSLDETRVLTAAVSADWIRAEHVAASGTLLTAGAVTYAATDFVEVCASSAPVVSVTPAYGVRDGLVDGETYVFTADAETVLAPGLTATVTGWVLEEIAADGSVSSSQPGDGTRCEYVHTAGARKRLVWQVATATMFLFESTMTVPGYTGGATLKGFPVLVRISPATVEGFAYSSCQADGRDVQFLSEDGATVYPHEIERWDPSGTSLVWVRLPQLQAGATSFLFRFGNPSLTTAAVSTGVWTGGSSGDYAAVWHFSEKTTDGLANAVDSAKRDPNLNLDAVPNGTKAQMVSTEGVIGLARVNSTGGNNSLLVENFPSVGLGSVFTMSGWFKATAIQSYRRLIGQATVDWNGTDGWAATFESGNNTALKIQGYAGGSSDAKVVTVPDVAEWTHIVLVADHQSVSCYTNGAYADSGFVKEMKTDIKPLIIGNSNITAGWKFLGQYDELRMLGGLAAPDWIAAEYQAAAQPDFVVSSAAHLASSDSFVVSSSLAQLGTVSPDYGSYEGTLAAGTRIDCMAQTDDIIVEPDVLKACIRGWKLFEYDDEGRRADEPYLTGDENSLTYVHEKGKARELVWQMNYLHPVVLAATREANFLINGVPAVSGTNWVEQGAVEVVAISKAGVEGSDYRFDGWRGAPSGSGDTGKTNLVLELNGPVSLTAGYVSFVCVATTGDDVTGDGTGANPFATVNRALAAAHPGDEVRIGGGTYIEDVLNDSVDALTIVGGFDVAGGWRRDLRGHPTVIRPVTASKAALTLSGVVSNRVDGLTLTGGKYGLSVTKLTDQRFDRLTVTNNTSGGISYAGAWQVANKVQETAGTLVFASSLVANNGGRPFVAVENDWAINQTIRILNCTVVSNAGNGAYCQLKPVEIVNSVFSGNGDVELEKNMTYAERGYLTVASSCIDGRIALGKLYDVLRYRAGNLRVAPRLDAAFAPAEGSLLCGAGADLSAADSPVSSDLYGEPFVPGAYDIGCVRSGRAAHAKLADVYVAADGNDANAGDDPSRAVKTVAVGLARTAAGGTCHVGPGAFAGPVQLDRTGVRLVGAGRDETELSLAATNEAVVAIAGNDVEVAGLSVRGGRFGVYVARESFATNALVRDCRISDCWCGLVQTLEGEAFDFGHSFTTTSPGIRVSRSIIANCADAGADLQQNRTVAVFDATVVRDNPSRGIYAYMVPHYLYNCTFIGNGKGLVSYAMWQPSREAHVYNTAFVSNAVGWRVENGGYAEGGWDLFENVSNRELTGSSRFETEGPLLDLPADVSFEPNKYGRPLVGSPLIGGGTDLTGIALVPVVSDNDNLPFSTRRSKRVIGAYRGPTLGLLLLVK